MRLFGKCHTAQPGCQHTIKKEPDQESPRHLAHHPPPPKAHLLLHTRSPWPGDLRSPPAVVFPSHLSLLGGPVEDLSPGPLCGMSPPAPRCLELGHQLGSPNNPESRCDLRLPAVPRCLRTAPGFGSGQTEETGLTGSFESSRDIMVTATALIFTMENSRPLRIFLSSPTKVFTYFFISLKDFG